MYSLYNEMTKQNLTHPRVGIWFSDSQEEANEMLDACKEYLTAVGLDYVIPYISVVKINEEAVF